MPQVHFLDSTQTEEESIMKATLKVLFVLVLVVGAFAAGWFTSNKGYRVVNSDGSSLVKSNAAQIVKDENARLAREVVGKSEHEAEQLLVANNRTLFVGVRDGHTQEYKGQKTFTNLTVEIKEGKVIKILGWY